MARQRTFGWVQNPNRLENLKYVVGIFDSTSPSYCDLVYNKLPLILHNNLIEEELYNEFMKILSLEDIFIPYTLLKGKGSGGRKRKDALCSGIIQAAINAQKNVELEDLDGNKINIKKPYTDDWTADGYLRWAISTGLVFYSKGNDSCCITNLGRKLVHSQDGSDEEKEYFSIALLSYPPVVRILDIMQDRRKYTKFELGEKLGFKGEMGFTSIEQDLFVAEYCQETNPKNKRAIRSNLEGDSDKYARTITNWLCQLGWIENTKKVVGENFYEESYSMELPAYRITIQGIRALKKSKGNSKYSGIPKIVMYEMLATKTPNANYIRKRRALIIESINKKAKNLYQIKQYLEKYGVNESISTIKDDIDGLVNIGITVTNIENSYRIPDNIINLEIPEEREIKDEVTILKGRVRDKLEVLNHKYLILIDLAYDSSFRKNFYAREFEIQTAELFVNELNFKGKRLGDSNKPDIIISYEKNGTIIDNKSYKDGFNLDSHCADEMNRYIEQNQLRNPGEPSNEWWKNFDPEVTNFTFLFITSYLKGNFKNNLEYLSNRRNISGAVINVENLLYLAEDIKKGKISYEEFFSLFNNNEIVI